MSTTGSIDGGAGLELGRPSLVRWSMFAAGWWFSVVAGLSLVGYAVVQTVPKLPDAGAAFWVIVGLVVLGELRPVITAGGYNSEGVVTSHAFVFAAMYLYGPWPALTFLALATLMSQLTMKKAAWKVPFNVGQYNLSVAPAALIMVFWLVNAGERVPTLANPSTGLDAVDLIWVVAGWFAFFLTNNSLVSVMAGDERRTFSDDFFEDLGYYFFTTFAVLALSPLVVFVAPVPIYLPLLLLPLYAVHKTASISRE